MEEEMTKSIQVRRSLVLFLAVFLTATGLLFVHSPKSHALINQHQLVPMYIYPSWWVTGNDWYRACDNMNASGNGSTAIMNPSNGPGSSRDSDYDYVINRCHQDGNNVIGYVDTGYGSVALSTVESQIDDYYAWYNTNSGGVDGRIDGIFLDEMNNFPTATVDGGLTATQYYHTIYNYIKSKDPTHTFDDVIGNPGAPSATDWQVNDTGTPSTQAADEIVIFEGPETGTGGLSSFSEPSWTSNYSASTIAMLVYDTPDADLASVCSTLQSDRAGLVDVTDATITSTATPWNFFQGATYWSDFVSNC
jgi:hypothetical protein